MDYLIFSFSLMLVYIGLAQLLHVQFGLLGIPNFGVVGFWGLGLYGTGVLYVSYDVPLVPAIIVASLIVAVVSYVLASMVLQRSGQAILAATLAFAAMVATLVVTEKQLTNGVQGLGTIGFPFGDLASRNVVYFGVLLAVVVALIWVSAKLRDSRMGRMMIAIRDNEELAASLGKDTAGTKRTVFVVTCALMGLLGGLTAPLHQFLVPYHLAPSLTFAVWIALVLGGKSHNLGAMIGVFATFGLFDILIETYAPVPAEQAIMLPNFKLFCYGVLLVMIIMFRPAGMLGEDRPRHRARADAAPANDTAVKEG
ncbi:branched-chain amino acid ABC transporter permease [uncultured Tateyamaria sp.]|uniref:branched-chain amino acid ABC transporter permease n=1 Tax=uncultured Tateyamaria sp. TaxID=455651 RepID=UPI0026196302|nr:branched-chain amino acid ABC transporter permease [uncultured Tateyamaria sp.]